MQIQLPFTPGEQLIYKGNNFRFFDPTDRNVIFQYPDETSYLHFWGKYRGTYMRFSINEVAKAEMDIAA